MMVALTTLAESKRALLFTEQYTPVTGSQTLTATVSWRPVMAALMPWESVVASARWAVFVDQHTAAPEADGAAASAGADMATGSSAATETPPMPIVRAWRLRMARVDLIDLIVRMYRGRGPIMGPIPTQLSPVAPRARLTAALLPAWGQKSWWPTTR
jgi:hypothetical protein